MEHFREKNIVEIAEDELDKFLNNLEKDKLILVRLE